MKKLVIAAALSAAFIAAPAAAQTYIGGGIGKSDTDTQENSWKVYGGYQFTPAWGVELGYTDLGNYLGEEVESWSLAGTATLPMGQKWSLIGKLGFARNNAEAPAASQKSSTLMGVGVGYALNPNLGLRLEYEDYGKLADSGAGTTHKGSQVLLSAKYSF
jgi:OOP family OmpA-OmpF porin